MPNYRYKCEMCNYEETFALPISSDPLQVFPCPTCSLLMMTRRISNKPSNFILKSKETLGKWYKKQTGKDLLGGK